MGAGMPKFLALAFERGIARRSAIVAIVVGTILNLINQGDVLLLGTHVSLWKVVLTYAVPYCVATYGAVSYRASISRAAGKR